MTPGPLDFRGPIGFRGPMSSRGAIEMTLRNEHVKPEDLLFFFGDHLISAIKIVRILVKTLFFVDHIIFRTKLQHFLRLFWTLQNWKSVTFELAPGPLLVPGATVIGGGGGAGPLSPPLDYAYACSCCSFLWIFYSSRGCELEKTWLFC